ncbi:cold shock small protein YmcF [Escherichia coli]
MTNHIHFRCPCCHGSQYRTLDWPPESPDNQYHLFK